MTNQPHYPLGDGADDGISAASGRKLSQITLEAAAAGELSDSDFQIRPDTLRQQALVAQSAGYTQLAENLVRAAELTAVPNAELLLMYEALRPGRASHAEMLRMADRLEHEYQAPENAKLFRQAAQVYLQRSFLRKD
ncbi:MAG TPA: diol dehydratase small subunit [Anaerolineae bacterium]